MPSHMGARLANRIARHPDSTPKQLMKALEYYAEEREKQLKAKAQAKVAELANEVRQEAQA